MQALIAKATDEGWFLQLHPAVQAILIICAAAVVITAFLVWFQGGPMQPTLPPGSPDWPCRHYPGSRRPFPPRLLDFLYVLLRDGAQAPGDVEQLALNVKDSTPGTQFTNPHLEMYARSLAGYLLNHEEDIPMKPTLGRIVIYRSRTGAYSVPAIINCTTDSLNPVGVEKGHIPDLESEEHVHLTVFTPGKPGLRVGADDFKVQSKEPVSENVAGCYQEWNIPHDENDPTPPPAAVEQEAPPEQAPGTWRWPERV